MTGKTHKKVTNQFYTEVLRLELGICGRRQRVTTASVWRKRLMQQLSIETPGEHHLK